MTSDNATMETKNATETLSSPKQETFSDESFRRLPTLTFQETYAIATGAKASGKLADATDTFSQLVQGLVEYFTTPLHPEMGWIWLEYGRCLYQSGVANNDRMLVATKKSDEEETLEEKQEETTNAADEESPKDIEKNEEDIGEEGDEEWQDEDEEDADAQEEEVEESDLEAAWQALETARLIFSSQANIPGIDERKKKLMLAETYLALGDVSLEEEKFDQAIQDYRAGLAVRESILTPDDRTIAETLYLIALALENDEKYDDAVNEMKRAVACLEKRKSVVQQAVQDSNFASSIPNDPKGKAKLGPVLNLPKSAEDAKSELEDLSALIPELTTKIKEIQASALEARQKSSISGPQETIGFGNATTASVAPKPVADLTSMVKKKQPAVSTDAAEEESRKRKMDDASKDAVEAEVEKKPKL